VQHQINLNIETAIYLTWIFKDPSFVGKYGRERPFGRPGHRLGNNIKMNPEKKWLGF
jgi:hypothetical protein